MTPTVLADPALAIASSRRTKALVHGVVRRGSLCALAAFGLFVGGAARALAEDAPLDLTKVAGAEKFPGGPVERELLARNGFVVLPRYHKQIFSPYIGGPLPHYVTCDSAHHTYQVLFETTLMEVERALAQRLSQSIEHLHARLVASVPTTPRLRAGHELAQGYVAVARRLLGGAASARREADGAADAEVRLIESAAGPAESPLFRVSEDYADYRPRGRYAGDAAQERYFRTVKWLTRMGFRVRDDRETLAAVLLVRAVQQDAEARAWLESIERLLGTLVGPADDLTLAEYATALRATVPGEWTDAALEASLADLRRSLAAMRDPEINASLLPPDDWRAFRERTKGLRVLPARWTPDAWLFQSLNESEPADSHRTGLEVATALGSRAAEAALASRGGLGKHAAEHARAHADDMRRRAKDTHYGASLGLLSQVWDEQSPLLGYGSAPDGDPGTPVLPAPMFRSTPWRERLLSTGLGAWTSLRHAWVLHAKSTAYYLGASSQQPGVVEPAPQFYAGLAGLARSLSSAAEGAGAFRMDSRLALAEMLPALKDFAAGEVNAEEMTRIDAKYGSSLARLPLADGASPSPASIRPLVRRLEAWLARSEALDAKEKAWVESLGTSETGAFLGRFATLMDELGQVSEQELAGRTLTEAQVRLVKEYGTTIAELNFFRGNSWLEPREQMGCVVDVASDRGRSSRLLEAVGPAMEIYVALPLRGGGHQLYSGGVYSHFEFDSEKPLTDEEWRARIEERRLPPHPTWTSSYIAVPDVSAVVAKIEKGEMPDEADDLRDERVGRALIARLHQVEAGKTDAEKPAVWLTEHAAAYGEGPLHEQVVDALLGVLLSSDLEAEYVPQGIVVSHHGRSTWCLNAAAYLLARMARPSDRARLISAVVTPPAGSSANAREWVAIALGQLSPPTTPGEAKPMLEAADAQTRWCGVDALLQPLARDPKAPVGPAVEYVVARLDGERDERVVRTALRGLAELAPRIDRGNVGRFAVFLNAKESRTRAVAAALLGALHDFGSVDRLLALLGDDDQEVAAAAAKALGGALAGSTDDRARRAIEALEANIVSPTSLTRSTWAVQQSSLEGIGSSGGELGAAALERIATNAKVDDRLRRNSIAQLREIGKPAIPSLYRLTFDETETGNGSGDHAERLCDAAAEALDRALGGQLGWGYGWPGEKRAKEIFEQVRKEAREKGYAR